MWISVTKLVFCLYLTTASASSYHSTKTKTDYMKRREQYLNKNLTNNNKSLLVTTTTSFIKINNNNNNNNNVKFRHQESRFPHLDRVMNKLNNMNSKNIVNNNYYSNLYHKTRHNGNFRKITTTTTTTTEPPSEDFEFLDSEDYDNTEYEEDIEEDDEFLDSNTDVYDEDWQAEEPTQPPQQVHHQEGPSMSLSDYKWKHYGTRARVTESRNNQLHLQPNNERRAIEAVIEHFSKVREEGQCRKPLPKVIQVQREHPDPYKTYTPHCTILHRCAEDTGCCSMYGQKCGPKEQHTIELYFYAKKIGSTINTVEKLSFHNHTECACVSKSASTENTKTNLALKSASHTSNYFPPEPIKKCTCPEVYVTRYRYSTGCGCDCEEYNEDCQRMKKGEEYFSLKDRKCILDNKCGKPSCEYGPYIQNKGRCPREHEQDEYFNRRL